MELSIYSTQIVHEIVDCYDPGTSELEIYTVFIFFIFPFSSIVKNILISFLHLYIISFQKKHQNIIFTFFPTQKTTKHMLMEDIDSQENWRKFILETQQDMKDIKQTSRKL